MRYRLPAVLLQDTFNHFRRCGGGRRECQALWISAWREPGLLTAVIHPLHAAHGGGFRVDDAWLNAFWQELAARENGVRLQIHTHPRQAFHSRTDDEHPIIHQPGFLSLVVPTFAMGEIGFDGAYLAEIAEDGRWREVSLSDHIEVV